MHPTSPTPGRVPIRSVDRELLLAMHAGELVGIGDLTAELKVTATAVRQRIERLLDGETEGAVRHKCLKVWW